MSCEHTFVEKSLCSKQLNDIKGFAGNYQLDLGEGQTLPLSFKRKSKGIYHLDGNNNDPMIFQTCIVNGKNVAETISQTDKNKDVYLLLEINKLRSQLEMKSILLDEDKLTDENISYQYETSEIMGETISVMLVKNQTVSSETIIKQMTNTSSRQPFYLLLDKR